MTVSVEAVRQSFHELDGDGGASLDMNRLDDLAIAASPELLNQLVVWLNVLVELSGEAGVIGQDGADVILGRGRRMVLADGWVELLFDQVWSLLRLACACLFDLHFCLIYLIS